MTEAVTLQDIYNIFQRSQEEADRRFAEADRRAAEADRRFAESKAEADRLFAASKAEDDRRAAEASARFEQELAASKAEFDREMAASRAEFERSKREFDRRIAKSERIAAQASQSVNGLSSRWGQFVENLVAPAAVRLFQGQGIEVTMIAQRVRAARQGRHLEIDILAVNTTVAVVIEVKSRFTQDYLQQFLINLRQFKEFFPQYASYQVYGAIAGIEMDSGVDTAAARQGLFVIEQSGDSVTISNEPAFQPRTW